VVVAGVVARLLGVLRFGRSGSDTIPLAGRSDPGNQGALGGFRQADAPARTPRQGDVPARAAAATTTIVAPDEETDVAIKEPSIIASPNRALALTAGTVLTIWGILGFFFAHERGHAFFGDVGGLLWNAFQVNPALGAVWTLMAFALFIVGLGNTIGSRNVNLLVGILLVVLAVYGFVFSGTSANVFALNTPDNVFNAIVGVVLVLTALGADKQNISALRAAQA
jgi:hypothetical protein